MLEFIFRLFHSDYGSKLEQYITSQHTKHNGDVDRLTIEFDRKKNQLWN